jgi:hypothetical protein
MNKIVDINNLKLKDGDVIDILQTVNGQNLFFVKTVSPLDIRYDFDRRRKYEYDQEDLIRPNHLSGEPDFKIISNEINTPK